MSANKRLTEVFESAEEIAFDDSSKFVLFSDCHRGDNSWSDDLAHNQILLWHALKRYYEDGFTYIEVGDGDELWENKKFEDIRKAHSHLYWQMRQFHQENRLYLIWGNHNADWKEPKNVERYLYAFHNERTGENEPLFDGLTAHEGLVLRHSDTGNRIFVVHGHQGDLWSDRLWWFSKFVVRYVWKPLQMVGIKDPTSPAKNFKKRREVEQKIIRWIKANDNQMIICGHTHRPMFPQVGKPLYFNIGSCVHPRCITGIEIQDGKIELVKWWVRPDDKSGVQQFPLLAIFCFSYEALAPPGVFGDKGARKSAEDLECCWPRPRKWEKKTCQLPSSPKKSARQAWQYRRAREIAPRFCSR